MSARATYKDANNRYALEYGYSRAVRRGPFISVAGTTSINPTTGQLEHIGSAYDQAKYAFEKSVEAIAQVQPEGTTIDVRSQVTRVRMFVKHASDCDDVGRAMRDVLRGTGTDSGAEWVATMIVGARFVMEDMLVEVEVDAIVGY